MTYTGSPWRSLYLGAPKYAHDLASHPRFCRLGDVARVRLGLKTGNDGFFFVRPLRMATAETLLSGRSRRILVRGLNGWEGEVQSRDLLPAVLNPHHLFHPDNRRRLRVPSASAVLYLYPRDQAPAAELSHYVSLAEAQGVHTSELVRQNGSPNRWYRQARTAITARWALPYNSAYDYGAWDNAHGAVINGRFVGVEPDDNVDADLLGASLNTTFVILGRLLQGQATGVESAYDVGPPAARLVRIPDPRQFRPGSQAAVRSALDELRGEDFMPPAPDEHAVAHALRRRLDQAVLEALGCTAGEASVVAGRSYESYARWRRTRRSMQTQMETYRRAMTRTGVSRGVDPLRRAGQQVWEELQADIPICPASMLAEFDVFTAVDVDAQWRPGGQRPMIDPGYAIRSNGVAIDLGSWAHVRYAAMLLDLGFRPPLRLPSAPERAEDIVDRYEQAREAFLARAGERANMYAGADAQAVVEYAIDLWRRACRQAGMEPETAIVSPELPASPRRS